MCSTSRTRAVVGLVYRRTHSRFQHWSVMPIERSVSDSNLPSRDATDYLRFARWASLYLSYALFTPSLRTMPRNGRMASLAVGVPLLALRLIGRVAVRVLEILFGLGIAGSALVVVITFVDDLKEVFLKDEPAKFVERSVSTKHAHV